MPPYIVYNLLFGVELLDLCMWLTQRPHGVVCLYVLVYHALTARPAFLTLVRIQCTHIAYVQLMASLPTPLQFACSLSLHSPAKGMLAVRLCSCKAWFLCICVTVT